MFYLCPCYRRRHLARDPVTVPEHMAHRWRRYIGAGLQNHREPEQDLQSFRGGVPAL